MICMYYCKNMDDYMQFNESLVYINNLSITFYAFVFLLYGLFNTQPMLQFYKLKFYVVFIFHFYGMILNGLHGIVVRHNVINLSLTLELSVFTILFCIFVITIFWTYWFYLRRIYSMATGYPFKSFSQIMQWVLFWKAKHKDYYDYEIMLNDDNPINESASFGEESEDEDENVQNPWFMYINYQILGNYLFAQIFNIFALMCTYLIRSISYISNIDGIIQLTFLSMGMVVFCIILGYFDFKYRRFTKSFIMPHLTVLTILLAWMIENYKRFNKVRPEPISLVLFIGTFMHTVIKFSFLSEYTGRRSLKQN